MGKSFKPDVGGAAFGLGTAQAYNWAEYAEAGEVAQEAVQPVAPELAPAARIGVPAVMAFGVGALSGGVIEGAYGRVEHSKDKAVEHFFGDEQDDPAGELEGEGSSPKWRRGAAAVGFGSMPFWADFLSYTQAADAVGQSFEPIDPAIAAGIRSSPMFVAMAGGVAVGGGTWVAGRYFDPPRDTFRGVYESAKEDVDDICAFTAGEIQGGYDRTLGRYYGSEDLKEDFSELEEWLSECTYDNVRDGAHGGLAWVGDQVEGAADYTRNNRVYRTLDNSGTVDYFVRTPASVAKRVGKSSVSFAVDTVNMTREHCGDVSQLWADYMYPPNESSVREDQDEVYEGSEDAYQETVEDEVE